MWLPQAHFFCNKNPPRRNSRAYPHINLSQECDGCSFPLKLCTILKSYSFECGRHNAVNRAQL
jgi:hypothetical protein